MKDLVTVPLLASLVVGNGFQSIKRDPFSITPQDLKIDKKSFLKADGKPDLQKWKKFESSLPTVYRWRYGRTHKKKMSLQIAQQKLEVLKDYSVLLYGCGAQGTGWILDYVLPDKSKGEKYPTRWFIGTAAHVAAHFSFDAKNPYGQLLPKNHGGRCSEKSNSDSGIVLGKEKPDVSKEALDRSKFKRDPEFIKKLVRANPRYGVVRRKDDRKAKNVDKWWFWSEKPKLVYSPYNYLTKEHKNYSKYRYDLYDYAVDFAVFEVNFVYEEVAKLFTRDFYGKYNRVNGTKKDQALNFFDTTMVDKYTNTQLLEKDIKVLGVGYPQEGISNNSSSNYNSQNNTAGRFSYYRMGDVSDSELKDKRGEDMLGHFDMWLFFEKGKRKDLMWTWADRKMHMRGYGYAIENNPLSAGASGGLFVTEDGDVLGTLFAFTNLKNYVSAIRNKEIRDRYGNVLYPAYDLMEGVKDQLISYKSQIQTYVLSKCKQTELSRLRKWENIMGYDRNCPKTTNRVLS